MEDIFKIIEYVGGALSSILVIIYFFNTIILPFFIKLELQLTKDLFFRLTDTGEIFFSKIIVFAPINMQITDCNFELKGEKEDTQSTSYNCKAESFGSVERNSIGATSVASHYLPKSSPEFLLEKGYSKEILIRCNIAGSKQKIKNSIAQLKEDYEKLQLQESTGKARADFINQKMKQCTTGVLSSIKIESGNHKLVCNISYKYKYSFFSIRKKRRSEIDINIKEEDLLKLYKSQNAIDVFLFDYLSFFVGNKNINIRFPELIPRD